MQKYLIPLINLVGVLAFTIATAKPARADLKVCNSSKQDLSIAIAYRSRPGSSSWTSKGWYNIDKDDCKTLWIGNLVSHSSFWYYHAKGTRGSRWTGRYSFCIRTPGRFEFFRAHRSCLIGDWAGFQELYTGGKSDFTLFLY